VGKFHALGQDAGQGRAGELIDGEDFARRLLGPPWRTFLLPGSSYGEPNHIRLGVGGGPDARLEVGLARLADCLARWGEAAQPSPPAP
jgi:aspartate/methionine/tyrosine aminotransferase